MSESDEPNNIKKYQLNGSDLVLHIEALMRDGKVLIPESIEVAVLDAEFSMSDKPDARMAINHICIFEALPGTALDATVVLLTDDLVQALIHMLVQNLVHRGIKLFDV